MFNWKIHSAKQILESRIGLEHIEFARAPSLIDRLDRYANLVILRTLSKAYALAGARCGALLAHADIVSLLARVITPYSLPTQTIEAVLKFTDAQHRTESQQRIELIRSERARMSPARAEILSRSISGVSGTVSSSSMARR